MALFGKAEFAAECGASRAHVSMAIKRGKLILDEDGRIDTTNPVNSACAQSFRENSAKRAVKGESVSNVKEMASTDLPIKPKQSKPKKEQKQPQSRINPNNHLIQQKFEIDLLEKQSRIKAMEVNQRLQEMKEMKLTGQLIPTDLTYGTIRQLSQSFLVNFSNSMDALMVDVAKKLKIDRSTLADLRKQVKKALNSSIDLSVSDAQKNVENITKEYSQRKNAA